MSRKVHVSNGRAARERRQHVAGLPSEASSPAEQVEMLDQRLGKGVGAAKERARLSG